MKAVTSGEKLFLLVRDEILDQTGDGAVRWANVGSLLQSLSGGNNFTSYLKGAAAIHATRRLLRYWEGERPNVPNASSHVRLVTNFIRREVFPSIGTSLASQLARAVTAAERASNRPVNSGVRTLVLGNKVMCTCYLCGRKLNPKAGDDSEEFLTLEHLWPTSVGGDSIAENLIPSCRGCQHQTQDAMSWEWLNIHNLMLPSSPSEKALRSMPRSVRYARHYFEALRLSDLQHLTLKEAFVGIGPITASLTYVSTGLPINFLILKLPKGWIRG